MDLLEVPKDRLPICLEELADYLELARVTVSGVNTLGRLMGVKDACKLDGFTWIDDGARDQTLTITPMAESSQNQLR